MFIAMNRFRVKKGSEEAFELRMVDVERLVLARIPVGGAEFG